MDTERLLFYVVTVCVIVFLLVAIFFLYQLIQISRNVRSLAEKADDAADNVVSVSEAFRRLATPVAVGSIVSQFFRKTFRTKRKGKR